MITVPNSITTKRRIQSIDILRGAIMIIMALDHTRDFFNNTHGVNPVDVTTTTPALFFSRWITHYCAPNFVFLSGISIYLAGTRRTPAQLTSFLITRGLWLIVFEIVFLTFALTLNPAFNIIVLQVIWVIGLSIIIIALVKRLPVALIAAIGLLIVFGHNILDYLTLPKTGAGNFLIVMFMNAAGSVLPLGGGRIILDLYAILPWTGVMMLGYVFGNLYRSSYDAEKRRKILLVTGLCVTALFILLRFINKYGDPNPWSSQPRGGFYTFLFFLDTSKYPPSLIFLCMTIGPALILLALTENVQNKFTQILKTYGSVPFFYYGIHFYLIRALNVVVFFVEGYKTSQIANPKTIFLFQPDNFGFSLPVSWLLWIGIVATLYLPCRWFSRYKKTHSQWWLSYL